MATRRPDRPLWFQIRSVAALGVFLGVVIGLSPLWIWKPGDTILDLVVSEAFALLFGVLGGIGLWAAAKIRAGGTSKSRFARAFVKGFLPYNDDAMGKTGEEFWARIRAKTR